MGDNTAKNLADAQKEELQAEIAFQQLQAAKLSEIASATKQKDAKEVELSDLLNKVAAAKRDVERTTKQLEEDKRFLAQTMKGCKEEDQAYAARSKVRSEEIVALTETLTILTGDEARSLFDKTISFLQVSTVEQASMTARQERAKTAAMKRILATAKKSKNWALASLAVQVRLDAFTKVKAAMDKMLAELAAEQKAEYEKGEACKKELDETEDKIKVATNEKEDLDMKHTELSNELAALAADIKSLEKEVADMEVSLKEAGEQRKANNALYQQSVNDQRATVQVLNMASARLHEFYGFAQVRAHAAAPPPPKPSGKAYAASENSGGVMQMLASIISDAESVESQLKITEQDEQKDYSEFVVETTASIESARVSIEDKEERTAQAEGEKSETEESQLANKAALAELNELLSATHTDCDWILKYFALRQKSRAEGEKSETEESQLA